MIRCEIVIKSKHHCGSPVSIERALKREIVEAVFTRAETDDAEITRIQFFVPQRRKKS